MKKRDPTELSQLSMLELFRFEVENQTALLTSALLELERAPGSLEPLETLMRAAHSLKGAARIVNLPAVGRLVHAMEDCFAAVQRERLLLDQTGIDVLLRGVDLLAQLARRSDMNLARWETEQAGQIEEFIASLAVGALALGAPASLRTRPSSSSKTSLVPKAVENNGLADKDAGAPGAERVVRLNAENLNRLLGLAGESLTESRWVRPFADSLQRLNRRHVELARHLGLLQETIQRDTSPDHVNSRFKELFRELGASQQFLTERMQELEIYDRRSAQLSHRLYLEALRTRMRPFADCIRRFPRMARDLARSLDKEVKLEITGQTTQVDRDILERLEIPLAHLLRNAVDHGCETPPGTHCCRQAAGMRCASGRAP